MLDLSICRKCSLKRACWLCPYGVYGLPQGGSGQVAEPAPEEQPTTLHCQECGQPFQTNNWLADALFTMGIPAVCKTCTHNRADQP